MEDWWIPTHIVLDCESDDFLCILLLNYICKVFDEFSPLINQDKNQQNNCTENLGKPIELLVQLPMGKKLNVLEQKFLQNEFNSSHLKCTKVFRDPDSKNKSAILSYQNQNP
jgi:hypothetical protein